MKTKRRLRQSLPRISGKQTTRPVPVPMPIEHKHRARDFGVGYGNSSGYGYDQHFIDGHVDPMFRCV